MRAFVAVVEAGGVTRAAPRLHVVQSAVSQAIARLERELEVVLLDRRPDGARPTAVGDELFTHAGAILARVAEAERALSHHRTELRGRVAIGLLPSLTPLLLSDLLRVLRRGHPGLLVDVEEALQEELLGGVRRGTLDIAVVWASPDEPSLGAEGHGSIPLVGVVAADHRLAQAPATSLVQLRDEAWVTFPAGGPGYRWLQDAAAEAGFVPRIAAAVETLAELKAFVEAGVGVTLLPAGVVASEVGAGLVRTVVLRDSTPCATVGWVADPSRRDPTLDAVRGALRDIVATVASLGWRQGHRDR